MVSFKVICRDHFLKGDTKETVEEIKASLMAVCLTDGVCSFPLVVERQLCLQS